MAKGGGGKGLAKLFGALFEVLFFLDALKGILNMGKMSGAGRGVWACQKIGAVFWTIWTT